MRITSLIFSVIVLFIYAACNSSNFGKNNSMVNQDTAYNILKDPVFNFDTTGMSMNERINKLMELSCLKKFDEERTDFINKDVNNIFKVGEIQKKGNNYQYEVTSDQYGIGMKYLCTPKTGEYTRYIVGVDSIVSVYYKSVKLMLKWDECNQSQDGESCRAMKQIEIYPVKTFFKFDYVRIDKNNSQLTYFKKYIPIDTK